MVARVLPIKGSVVCLVAVQRVTLVAVPQIPELMLNIMIEFRQHLVVTSSPVVDAESC